MTQVQTMTNPELNRALAELMGFTIKKMKSDDYAFSPDYCTDPAASLEVQTKAIEVDAAEYVVNLSMVKSGVKDYRQLSPVSVSELLNASPRERSEAAYITLSQANTAPGKT